MDRFLTVLAEGLHCCSHLFNVQIVWASAGVAPVDLNWCWTCCGHQGVKASRPFLWTKLGLVCAHSSVWLVMWCPQK